MSLIVDGISPTSIECDGVDLNILNVNGVNYWGKPFALTIDAGENTTITVTRTSSRYQNAELGELSNGSLIYYGDHLTATVKSVGTYELQDFKYNGTSLVGVSGETEFTQEDFGVSGAITFSSTARYVASWHQVFSGWQGHTNGLTGSYNVFDTASYTKTVPLAIDLSAYSFTAIRIVGQGTCSVEATVSSFDVTFRQPDIDIEKELTTVTVGSYTGSVQKGVWNGGSSVDFIVMSARNGATNVLTQKANFASAGVAVKNIYLYY